MRKGWEYSPSELFENYIHYKPMSISLMFLLNLTTALKDISYFGWFSLLLQQTTELTAAFLALRKSSCCYFTYLSCLNIFKSSQCSPKRTFSVSLS